MNKSVLEKIQDPYVENHYNMTSTSAQFPAPKHSGRVPNMNDPALQTMASRPYSLYDTRPSMFGDNMRTELIGHIHKETPLNKLFFSSVNLENIQKQIQEQVWLMSDKKHRIDKQDEDEIKIIMRSYYLMFARNDTSEVAQELEDLNRRTVGYAAAKIYSELDFYMFYRKDIEDFAPPIANPMNVAVHGTRYGELKSFF